MWRYRTLIWFMSWISLTLSKRLKAAAPYLPGVHIVLRKAQVHAMYNGKILRVLEQHEVSRTELRREVADHARRAG